MENLKNEIWEPVKGYTKGEVKYFVSNEGRVKSLCMGKEHILKQNLQSAGYLSVYLYTNGFPVCALVHRLVCEAFHPNTEHKPCVNHINEIKTCNKAENLEWVTYYENTHAGTNIERMKKAKSQAVLAIPHDGTKVDYTQEPLSFDSVKEVTDTLGICYESLIKALDNNEKVIEPIETFEDIVNPRYIPDIVLKDRAGRMWLFLRVARSFDSEGNITYTSPREKKQMKANKKRYVPKAPVADANGMIKAELPRNTKGEVIKAKVLPTPFKEVEE